MLHMIQTRRRATVPVVRTTFPLAAAFLVLGLLVGAVDASAESTVEIDEIVDRLEANRTYETSRAEMTMRIRDRFGERESTMISWSRGSDEMLIEFTSAAERGQKVLRTNDEIYLYYPDAAETVRLQGAALRESMLGSDVSYEDLTGGKTLSETYDARLLGTEEVDGRRSYVIELEAIRRNVAYPRQKLWVDADRFVALRAEQYALSGRLLKTVRFEDIRDIDGHPVPIVTVVSDALKRDSETRVIINEIEIGIRVRDDRFSLGELSW